MASKKRKKKTRSFEVVYWDEKGDEAGMDIVIPPPLSKLQDVVKLQKDLIHKYAEYDGSMGELFSDSTVIELIKKLASLMPVIGNDDPGFNVSNLFDTSDQIQLAHIFFTQSYTEETETISQYDQMTYVQERSQRRVANGEQDIADTINRVNSLFDTPIHRFAPKPSCIAEILDINFSREIALANQALTERLAQEREEAAKGQGNTNQKALVTTT
jgi:hypothetical protein